MKHFIVKKSPARSREGYEKPRVVTFNVRSRLIDNDVGAIVNFFLAESSFYLGELALIPKASARVDAFSRVIHLPSRGRPVTLLGAANGPRRPTTRKTFFLFTRGRAISARNAGSTSFEGE